MPLTVTVLDLRGDRSEHVVTGAGAGSTTAEVVHEIVRAAGLPPSTTLHLDGCPLDPDVPWIESAVHHGSILTTAHLVGGSPWEGPTARPEIHVVGGRGAGRIHRLVAGEATLGSDPDCTVVIEDSRVPGVCARLLLRHDGSLGILPCDDAHLTLDRDLVEAEMEWPLGALLAVGESRLMLVAPPGPPVALTAADETGRLDHNRPPRLLPPSPPARFVLPARPRRQHDPALPWLVMGLPLVMAVTLALVMREPRYLLMGVFSPLMMAGSHLQSRRGGAQGRERAEAEYADRLSRLEEDVTEAVALDSDHRRHCSPDPATALRIAVGPGPRLWERRPDDADHLVVRLGLADLDSRVVVTDPDEPEHRRDAARPGHDLPVTVALGRVGVLGIAAPGDLPRHLARWAIAQLCVLQSPRDLRVEVLGGATRDWEWMCWLPHADGAGAVNGDATATAERLVELTSLLEAREALGSAADAGDHLPHHVLVLDGARRLRTLPGVVALLARGPAVGIHTICLDADEHHLPEEAAAVVTADDAGRLRADEQGLERRCGALPDLVPDAWPSLVARALAPLRDVSQASGETVLPSAVRLVEVLGMPHAEASTIAERWTARPRSAEAVLGTSWDGPHAIDLDRDGPHALVAGTTGSGKSELLRALVASLAVANRPEELSFVLVDYKGGAAFRECARLPHTVGMVTDLDPHLVRRALTSLRAELRRRERLLAAAGVSDLREHVTLREHDPALPALPRLVVVVDEFAALARELPDFVSGLVDVAQRGRSLGLHLVLATQRPTGAVSPEIRANTTLRIALRTADAAESRDVIGTTDAADISPHTPGRAHVRRGTGAVVPVQVGGLQVAATPAESPSAWARPVGAPLPDGVGGPEPASTDLETLADAIEEAADLVGAVRPSRPWLPPLEDRITVDDLSVQPADASSADHRIDPLPLGLLDLPSDQDQRPWLLDLATLTHLAIVGSRSGRSQTLRTLAGAVASLTSAEDVHLHALDCGHGALAPLAALPHCGVVVSRAEPERVARLLEVLTDEVTRRRTVITRAGVADIEEQRRVAGPLDRLPHVLLLLDGWEGFTAAFTESRDGRLIEQVHQLLREGAAVGVHVIATGDRSLATLRTGSLFEHKLALRLHDRADLALLGLSARDVPDRLPDGRGILVADGTTVQVALLAADPSGAAQAESLRRLASSAAAPRAGRGPLRLDSLPTSIDLAAVWTDHDVPPGPWALLGVGGDRLGPVGLDLTRSSAAIIAGAPGSGRSTALRVVAESLLRAGTPVVVLAPRRSPLRDLVGRTGVRGVVTDPHPTAEMLEPLMSTGPVCVVVDDGELLRDAPAREVLRDLVRLGADQGRHLVLGGDSSLLAGGFTGWQSEAAGRQGLLLSPQGPTEGDLIGVRLSRSQVGAAQTPGRGLAHVGDGRLIPVQVPSV
ncbi:FtsK/SpoIIIE domain-containing protein [Alteromonas gracilis]